MLITSDYLQTSVNPFENAQADVWLL